uniref:Cobyrinate a,c-diamide synthase n=1 Tax=Candidatus Kentrum sp. LFY TaxID=2126342 RepID=A0A450UM39_9GAMM|nr:MAG: cobyrinic acid a,c-diamide synthase [Candidatus Kentron sp. LFY]VFJ95431.1 MAG: cobyrinic acid a,c-diamide synthase [Candidatus Kentron sp. LFY]
MNMLLPRLYLSATRRSSGKTTITVGLCAALRKRGLAVQAFKKGPDYIDPIWLGMASGHDCHNLDFHTMGNAEIQDVFLRQSAHADINLIEGNQGLYDGMDIKGRDSNAALARLLQTPVILIIDTRGMTRGVVPLLLGYRAFEPKVNIAGVLLNNVGTSRHEEKIRSAIDYYTELPVLGAIPRDVGIEVPERHLGLIPGNEFGNSADFINRAARTMGANVALERLIEIADASPPLVSDSTTSGDTLPTRNPAIISGLTGKPTIKIAIPRDPAFGFYYPDDLVALRRQGAEAVFFDTLSASALPAADALFIGGGFPEVHMEALEANTALRRSIRTAIRNGMPAYAECGGLMYLARGISWHGKRCEMVGAIPAETIMHDRPRGRGYVVLRETGKGPWNLSRQGRQPAEIKAHEFHHADVVVTSNPGKEFQYAYRVLRGHGIDGNHDGIVYRNLLAGFSHFRDVAENRWVERFVAYIRKITASRSTEG